MKSVLPYEVINKEQKMFEFVHVGAFAVLKHFP